MLKLMRDEERQNVMNHMKENQFRELGFLTETVFAESGKDL